MATVKELFKIENNKRNLVITSSVLAGALALGIVAGVQFKQFSDYETYFHIRNASMGRSRKENIETLVYVDSHKYYEYPYAKKSLIARIIGEINGYCKENDKTSMLIVPGRIGTSSPVFGLRPIRSFLSRT